ncbi:uncharacterized protein LOC119733959 isoform X4 [Patiria miniata]|uniref:SET domain-containing protein n=1 Tax=Patiria miniata TaxID=46514 RepID=A0A914AGZ3_PATMI|nr:uncharacterized protein LOC119733959 isoform X4 [Patiria miniata]
MSLRSKRKRVNPLHEAEKFIEHQQDRRGLVTKYINGIIGNGVFAEESFEKGDFLLQYHGDLISANEAHRREAVYPERNTYMYFFVHASKTMCIDATHSALMGRMVNDGQDANCKMKKMVIGNTPALALFATRQIEAGEQLLYDYGGDDLPWRNHPVDMMDLTVTTAKAATVTAAKAAPAEAVHNDSTVTTAKAATVTTAEAAPAEAVHNDSTVTTAKAATVTTAKAATLTTTKAAPAEAVHNDSTGTTTKAATVTAAKASPAEAVHKDSTGTTTKAANVTAAKAAPAEAVHNDSTVTTAKAATVTAAKAAPAEAVHNDSTVTTAKAATVTAAKAAPAEAVHNDSTVTTAKAATVTAAKAAPAEAVHNDSTVTTAKAATVTAAKAAPAEAVHNDSTVTTAKGATVTTAKAATLTTTKAAPAEAVHNDSTVTTAKAATVTAAKAAPAEAVHNDSTVTTAKAATVTAAKAAPAEAVHNDSTVTTAKAATVTAAKAAPAEAVHNDATVTTSKPATVTTAKAAPAEAVHNDATVTTSKPATAKAEHNGPVSTMYGGEVSNDDSLIVHGADSTKEILFSDDSCEDPTYIPECVLESDYDSDESYFIPFQRVPSYQGLQQPITARPSTSHSEGIGPVPGDVQSEDGSSTCSGTSPEDEETSNQLQDARITSTSLPNVTVLTTNNCDGRKWDKKHFCVFCMEPTPKLPRHLKQHHPDEPEVKHILGFPVKSGQRKKLLEVLRNRGNHAHNLEVLKDKKGMLIPYKRPTYETPAELYLPCHLCFGYFMSSDMWKHQKSCVMREEGKPCGKLLKSQCALLLPISSKVSDVMKNQIIGHMQHSDVALVARNDDLIIKLGMHTLGKVGRAQNFHQHVSQKMREVGRLLLKAREINTSIQTLGDCIDPKNFDDVVESVNVVAGLNEETGNYKTPSLALKLGHSLRKCALIVKADAIKSQDGVLREKAEGFEELCSILWPSNVSKGALTTIYERKWNKPAILPLSTDVMKVHQKVEEVVQEKKELVKRDPQKEHYSLLAKAIMVQLVLFNRRRSGEVERMTVDNYRHHHKEVNEEVLNSLSSWEKQLCTKLARVEIRGKRGRKVPILLTSSMIDSIDVLVEARGAVGVLDHNPHLFARPGCKSAYRGCDALKYFSTKSEAEHPEYVTSTKLRKHVATLSQVLCLKDNELDVLAGFMGHDIQIHREYYRLPESTLQTAKIAKLLMLLEKGQVDQVAGKTLDEIEVNLDEDCSEDEEQSSQAESAAEQPSQRSDQPHCSTAKQSSAQGSDQPHCSAAKQPSQRSSQPHRSATKQPSQRSRAEQPSQRSDQPHCSTAKQSSAQGSDQPHCSAAKQPSQRSSQPHRSATKQPSQRSRGKKSGATQKKVWSDAERQAVDGFFALHIRTGRVPQKHECETCIRENPVLVGTSWEKLKFRVHNLIKRH